MRLILFLAGILDQLDLALDHVTKGDVHNARFGLMLTDNALELVLHEIAKDKRSEAASWRYREEPYEHEAKLKRAFLGAFDNKIDFAKVDAGMSAAQGRTFKILHLYRNEVHHAGLAHETILIPLARFYLAEACEFIGTYQTRGLGWASNSAMPQRAAKYFTGSTSIPATEGDFQAACAKICSASGHSDHDLIQTLADDYERIVEGTDADLQTCADGVYEGQAVSRDVAVLQTQAWDIAFDDVGLSFLNERGFNGSVLAGVEELQANYPFRFRRDPIPAWRASAQRLRKLGGPHAALDTYHSFIEQTGILRAAIEQSAAAAEAEMDAAMDRMRGK